MEDLEAVALNWKLDEGPILMEEARGKVQWMMGNHVQNIPGRLVHLCLAIMNKKTLELIGWCGLDHLDSNRENPVLFYLLKKRYWGQGLATEAAREVLRLAFNEFGLSRIDSGAAFENIPSKRVMEKIGMRYLGVDKSGGHAFTVTKEMFFRD
jgi:RimJ/RimL family protein N-acetyltransferase